jgi:cation diffusion facilitator CzcD-associated flavoprotein CzcO
MSTNAEVIIIGAGPAGLAVAGQLRQRQISFQILESGNGVGYSWRNHYDRLHLHTVKEFSHLPDFPFPEDYPRYVPKDDLVDYYEAYAREQGLAPIFDCTVKQVEPRKDGWVINTEDGQTYSGAAVVLATGMNRIPFRPHLPAEEDYGGRILHSNDYENPAPFAGQRVLVVGMGNSGAEIALDLAEKGVDTCISVRGPVNIVPREIFGRPTQVSALLLAKLPHWLGDRIGLLVRRFTVGDMPRFGLQLPSMSPARQLRELGQTPVIDLGTLDYIRSGQIKVLPGIDHCTEEGVMCKDGEVYLFDAIIMATGFRAKVEDLVPAAKDSLDAQGLPASPVGRGSCRGLYFVGFNNYAPGGTLGIIRGEAEEVANHIAQGRLAETSA